MKVDMRKELDKKSLISHIVLEGLIGVVPESELESFVEKSKNKDGVPMYDLKITCNGVKLDFKRVVRAWEDQLERMIKDQAQELIDDKLYEMCRNIDSLRERINEEVKKHLYDWEKEEGDE